MKITIPSEVWLELCNDLSDYVLQYSSLDPITEIDENGTEQYTEEKQDQFCEIVDEVESIVAIFFKRKDD
tara:strand:+ start:467 stop:676 length:210 start_codon:yes stop_codon:yes gene_type:complete